jgi:hypothetical protein
MRPLLVADLTPEAIEMDRLQGVMDKELTRLDKCGTRYRMVEGHLLFIGPGACPFPGMDCRDSGHSDLFRDDAPGEPTGYEVSDFLSEMELWVEMGWLDTLPRVQLLDDGTLPTEEQVMAEVHLEELRKAAAEEQARVAAADNNPQAGEEEEDENNDDVARGVGLPRANLFNPHMSLVTQVQLSQAVLRAMRINPDPSWSDSNSERASLEGE